MYMKVKLDGAVWKDAFNFSLVQALTHFSSSSYADATTVIPVF